MNKPTQEDYINIISTKLSGFEQLAESIGKSRFLVYKSAMHAPDEKESAWEKEDKEMEAIADKFKCEIVRTDNTFSLQFHMNERNPGHFLEIVDEGMPAPLAGGNDQTGRSHNPDGTTYRTPTPMEDWENPVPGYAKPATHVISEIHTILKDLYRDAMSEAIQESKAEILALARQYAKERLNVKTKGG